MAEHNPGHSKFVLLIIGAVLALVACTSVAVTAGAPPVANGPEVTNLSATAALPATALTITQAASLPAPAGTVTPLRAVSPRIDGGAQAVPTPFPELWAMISSDGTQYYDTPGGLMGDIEHKPLDDGRAVGGIELKVLSLNAGRNWVELADAEQSSGYIWIPVSAVVQFLDGQGGPTLDQATALAEVPVTAELFPTMAATERAGATEGAIASALQETGVDSDSAWATAEAIMNPAPTPTAIPFPVLTVTPGPNCHPKSDGTNSWFDCIVNGQIKTWGPWPILRKDYLDQMVHGQYVGYLDLVMGKNGPPKGDIRELLKPYMLQTGPVGQPGAPELWKDCTYGDIAAYLSLLQDGGKYIRVIPGGPLKWDSEHLVDGADYYLNLAGAGVYAHTEFYQPGEFGGSTTVQLVSIKTGQVLKTGQDANRYYFNARLQYSEVSKTWLVMSDGFCTHLTEAGAWGWR